MTAPTTEKAAPIPADDLVDAVAKAISRHGYTEQVKGDGFAWWWNSLHDHPGNVFAHECREDDRAKARLALQVIMQDRASQEERIREDEPLPERLRKSYEKGAQDERDRLYKAGLKWPRDVCDFLEIEGAKVRARQRGDAS